MSDRSLPDAPDVEPGVYPTAVQAVDQWLTWRYVGGDDEKPTKQPFAPWADRDHPDVDPTKDARYSWSIAANWCDFDTVAEWVDMVPALESPGIVLQKPDDPYVDDPDGGDPFFAADYDDARDPDTGRIHPVVRDHIERAGTYADVSTSDTGIHLIGKGSLPDGVKTIDDTLPHDPDFPNASIEVYDGARFMAMTGKHVVGTPRDARNCHDFVTELVDDFVTVAEATPCELTRAPAKSRADLANVDTTDDIQDVFDAIQHVEPRDINLRSTVTEERADGSKSLNPWWASSDSGKRLAEVGDGWVYRKGMIGLDALQVVALEERIIRSERTYPTGDDFWAAVDALRKRGAHIPEYDPPDDAASVPVLPDPPRARFAAMGMSPGRSNDTISQADARERCQATIDAAIQSGDDVLIDALPSLGKSSGVVRAAATTDTPLTVLTLRRDLYDQIREWCGDHGLRHKTLPSFPRDCLTAAGEFGDEWVDRVMDWYNRGATPKQIHKHAEYELGRPLPCQANGTCPYAAKWDFDADDYDVLIGHPTHAHKVRVTKGRVVAFDEFPEDTFVTGLSGDRLTTAVTRFLQAHDGLPFDNYTDLIEGRNDDAHHRDALRWFDDHGVDADGTHVFTDDDAHATTPLAVYTLLTADGLGNGRERADLDDHGTGVYDREHGRVAVHTPPPLTYTKAILALDGAPTPDLWETALDVRIRHVQVLSDAERRDYIRDVLNLNLIRTTDAVKPYSSGNYVNVDQDATLIDAITDRHGDAPAVVTTYAAKRQYDDAGILDDVPDVEHYGNLKGSNTFASTRVGAVVGSPHYGDGYIKRWGALAGTAVDRDDASNGGKGDNLTYGDFGDRVLRHMRDHEVLQAAMRFGRDGRGAVVYVHTAAVPDWVPIAGEGQVVTVWSDGMKQVVEAARDMGDEWRTADIAAHDAVDISARQIRDHLSTLADRGFVNRTTEGRGYVWHDDDLDRVGDRGDVDLDAVDVDDRPADLRGGGSSGSGTYVYYYTWDFRKTRDGTNREEVAASKPGDANTPAD